LSSRDKHILEMLSKGYESSRIAEVLKLTDGTVRVYLHGLYKVIKVSNRTQAAVWWVIHKKDRM
jgi:DNA-binding NarL/FixJ family response regulator